MLPYNLAEVITGSPFVKPSIGPCFWRSQSVYLSPRRTSKVCAWTLVWYLYLVSRI